MEFHPTAYQAWRIRKIDQHNGVRVSATRLVTKIWKAIVPETRRAVTIMNDKS
jgi:hypothetical protein